MEKILRIILVEDDEQLGDMFGLILEKAVPQSSIIWCSSKAQALEAVKLADRIDVLVTDFDLTDGNSNEVMENARTKFPECKIVFMSGRYENIPSVDPDLTLAKPFSARALTEFVQRHHEVLLSRHAA